MQVGTYSAIAAPRAAEHYLYNEDFNTLYWHKKVELN